MNKSKWGTVSLIAGVLTFVFGAFTVLFTALSAFSIKKYFHHPKQKKTVQAAPKKKLGLGRVIGLISKIAI